MCLQGLAKRRPGDIFTWEDMSKTPKKRRVSLTTVDSPAALKGKRIECPGPIFHESPEKIYAGVILGTPSGKKNSVTVRFDEDGTRYW